MKTKLVFLSMILLACFHAVAAAKSCQNLFVQPYFITVANRLPVTAKVENDQIKISNAGGGLVAGLRSVKNFTWIGWPGNEVPTQYRSQMETSMQKPDMQIKPVYLSGTEKKGFYDEFSNRILWPMFHDMKPDLRNYDLNWTIYQKINKRFAEQTLKVFKNKLRLVKNQLMFGFKIINCC